MNKNLLFSVLALTASVFADGDNSSAVLGEDGLVAGRMDSDCNPKPKECPKPKPVCKPKPKPCEPCIRKAMQPIVLTSSRPCNDAGVYIFVDALFWHADVGNSDWAFVNNAFGAQPISGTNKDNRFEWNWGFRLGLGFDLDHDQWDTDFYYTWFRSHGHNSGSGSRASVVLPAAAASLDSNFAGTFTGGRAQVHLNYNVLDWELGRWFYVSNSISVRPHVGLKGAWNKVQFKESFSTGLTGAFLESRYSINDHSKSWAIGPSGGINTIWYFGCGNTVDHRDGHRGEVRNRPHWGIFGDFAGALMFTHFKNKHSETGSRGDVTVSGFSPGHLNRNQVVPVLQSMIGLSYDTCFGCDKYHFGFKLGYEFQWWFGQSQRLYVVNPDSAQPRYIRHAEDLGLQGLTIDVRFDF